VGVGVRLKHGWAQRTTVDLGREWSEQLLANGCSLLQGKAEFTRHRDRAAGC